MTCGSDKLGIFVRTRFSFVKMHLSNGSADGFNVRKVHYGDLAYVRQNEDVIRRDPTSAEIFQGL